MLTHCGGLGFKQALLSIGIGEWGGATTPQITIIFHCTVWARTIRPKPRLIRISIH